MDRETKSNTISPQHIDMGKILAAKGIKAPRWVVRWLSKLLHVDEINYCIYHYRDREGVDFAKAILQYLDIDMVVEHAERIPMEGYPIIVGNHPLGGADGMALISVVGERREDIRFPVNDFLMALPGLAPVFIPIDLVHRNTTTTANGIREAFAQENALLYFPAGACSRKIDGKIQDLEWKHTFIKMAVKYRRDIVPVFFDAQNRKRFYAIARLRQWLGFKFNLEMALLPSELFAQRGKRFRAVFGPPIPYSTFDERYTPREWAAMMHDYVYQLKENPDVPFTPQPSMARSSAVKKKKR